MTTKAPNRHLDGIRAKVAEWKAQEKARNEALIKALKESKND